MKNKIIYLLLASLMVLPGCADYLDQNPEELNSIDKIFTSDVDTRKWYARMYSDDFMVQEMHSSGQIPYFWCTDEAAYIQEGFIRNVSEGKMSPDNYYGYGEGSSGYNYYFFVRYYQAIRHINLFLENVDRCKEIGESERRKFIAEARFMRAYYHWCLVRLYGPVPIVDRSRTGNELATPQARNTFNECIEWIDTEINFACENGLPEKRTANDLGLPDVGVARALQSRIYLYAASPLYNGNTVYANWKNNDGTVLMPQTYNKELWKKAADAAKDVIDSGRYSLKQAEDPSDFESLVENIRTITTTWGQENPETIWGKINSMQWYGMCALPARWYGWNGRYSLPLDFINEFHMADGSRAPETDTWFENKQFSEEAGDGTIAGTFHMFVGREPRFYANIHFPNQRVNYQKPNETDSAQDAEGYGIVDFWFSGLSGDKYTTGDKNTTGFSVRKNIPLGYWSSKQNSNANRMMNCPFPLIRLGEIYLNYAEALNEYYGTERKAEILEYVNAIRERAGIPGHDTAKSYTQDELRQLIRHERKIELCYECHRFFDARRWFIAHGPEGVFNHNERGLDKSRGASATNDAGGSTCTDPEFFTPVDAAVKRFDLKHYFLPIKASEVMLNTALVQAPFY